jgi:hypothetical protein
MRYRKLDANRDYSFGRGQTDFLINSPEAVAQAIRTRLDLATGEWFLNTAEGTPYASQILGSNTYPVYDTAIKERIVGAQGVLGITDYTSTLDPNTRSLQVTATVETLYGTTLVTTTVGV